MALEGKLFRATHAFGPTDDPEDLTFAAGQIILVHDQGDSPDDWWEGELDGKKGTFPGSYVKPLGGVQKNVGGLEHLASGAAAPAVSASAPATPQATASTSAVPVPSSTPRSALKKQVNGPRRVSGGISWHKNQTSATFLTFGSDEYDRKLDDCTHENMMRASAEWDREEKEEKERQMYVQWETWERSLPPGTKCPQRLAHEAEIAKAKDEREKKRAEFKAKRAREKAAKAAEDAAAAETPTVAADPPPPAAAAAAVAAHRSAAPPPPPPSTAVTPTESSSTLSAPGGPTTSDPNDVPTKPPANRPAPQNDTLFRTVLEFKRTTNALEKEIVPGVTGFEKEYRTMDMEDAKLWSPDKCHVGTLNGPCNRYKDILPYDTARVPLSRGAYINASVISNLGPGCPDFFAAQGPKPNTIGHFWKMVGHHRCAVIVMLTRCVENNRPKCEEYWPSVSKSMYFPEDAFGPATGVICQFEKPGPKWTERRFTVFGEHGSHDVCQFHYTEWPDHGVPDEPESVIECVQATMRAQREAARGLRTGAGRPMVVHCSAGVGRSGVFCTLYALLSYLPHIGHGGHDGAIDIAAYVRHMRRSRRFMVQTLDQYKFCFFAGLHGATQYLAAVQKTGGPASLPSTQTQSAASLAVGSVLLKQLTESQAREMQLLAQLALVMTRSCQAFVFCCKCLFQSIVESMCLVTLLLLPAMSANGSSCPVFCTRGIGSCHSACQLLPGVPRMLPARFISITSACLDGCRCGVAV
eukprot:m.336788 g.336788  ORF g.336788 m.336788 type:complete len:752 (+) comp20542_c0_seq1:118-2373(+)